LKFLLDENADIQLADHLRGLGHDVTSVVEDYARAIADEDILEIARREARCIITNDTDFGDLVFRDRRPHPGVILFRLSDERLDTKIRRLDDVLDRFAVHVHEFIVVDDKGVRVRETPS
jgi:predicted nuclease of predicted toxin-antitoxin system